MLSKEDITNASYIISNRFEKVNSLYIQTMIKHIKDMGELTPTDLHRIEQYAIMRKNIDAITLELYRQTGLAIKDIYKLYKDSGISEYNNASKYYKIQGKKQVPFEDNKKIMEYLNAMAENTQKTFMNLANTTAISANYKDYLDISIQAVQSGTDTYTNVLRKLAKEVAGKGLRVKYKSGITRRLDSAARMNVLDGVRQLNNKIREQAGKEFGANGVQIDAHGLCANDHIDIQGRQYSLKEFNQLQNTLKRPISTCNCQHSYTYIVLGISPSPYSANDLARMQSYSQEQIEINGKNYSRYECSQLMRKTETAMRYKKDEIIALRSAGLSDDVKKAEDQLKELQAGYRNIASQAGLKKRYDRAYVPNYKHSK